MNERFASLQSALDESTAATEDFHLSLVRKLESAIADDPELCTHYLPSGGVELGESLELSFLPHNSSEYARVAYAIKKKLSPELHFAVVDVLVESIWGISNRGDDEDAYSFLVHIGQRVALPVETPDN